MKFYNILAFLSLSALCINLATASERQVRSNWSDFQNRHMVDTSKVPADATGWNALLKSRLGTTGDSSFGKKALNSFIVAGTETVSKDFSSTTKKYSGGSGSASNLYWSTNQYPVYVMNLAGQPGKPNQVYNVYNCGMKYIVAGIDESKFPVHFQGQATVSGGTLDKATAGCNKIN